MYTVILLYSNIYTGDSGGTRGDDDLLDDWLNDLNSTYPAQQVGHHTYMCHECTVYMCVCVCQSVYVCVCTYARHMLLGNCYMHVCMITLFT